MNSSIIGDINFSSSSYALGIPVININKIAKTIGIDKDPPSAASKVKLDVAGNIRISTKGGTPVVELGEGFDIAEGFDITESKHLEPGKV